MTFTGSHSCCRIYSYTPNPALYLLPNDTGTIGLPLSERDARALMDGCRQTSLGTSEILMEDEEARGAIEMHASQVCNASLPTVGSCCSAVHA